MKAGFWVAPEGDDTAVALAPIGPRAGGAEARRRSSARRPPRT